MYKKTIFFIGIFFLNIFLAVFFSGCDFVYKYLDKEGAEEKELVGEVTHLEKNPTVEEIQILLEIYGYNPGKIDGILGPRTRNAIEKFQKDNKLPQTRYADKETWAKLEVFRKKGLILKNDLNIKLIQEILTVLELDPGPIDGNFGTKTKTAVKKFQENQGLKVDGKVGYKTLTKLSDFLE